MSTHSDLPPSGSDYWVPCTASVAYIARGRAAGLIPEDDSTVYSKEGTEAHEWAAGLLRSKLQREDIPEEFRAHVEVFTDECVKLTLAHGGSASRIMIEESVPLFYKPENNGTIDYGIIGGTCGLHIRDLKYGKGVYVEAEEKYQLAIYARSLLAEFVKDDWDMADDLPVTLGIVQPRYAGAPPVRIWETTIGGLKEFCLKIAESVLDIRTNDNLKFAPSVKACQFCPARHIPCEHKAKASMSVVLRLSNPLSLLPDLTAPTVELILTFSDEQLVNVKRHAAMLKQFLNDVDDVLERRAAEGELPAGLKWVKGRAGNRGWADEAAASKFLRKMLTIDRAEPRQIISPTKAKELLTKMLPEQVKTFEALITRSDPKTVLALEEDKRPAVAPASGEDKVARLPELED